MRANHHNLLRPAATANFHFKVIGLDVTGEVFLKHHFIAERRERLFDEPLRLPVGCDVAQMPRPDVLRQGDDHPFQALGQFIIRGRPWLKGARMRLTRHPHHGRPCHTDDSSEQEGHRQQHHPHTPGREIHDRQVPKNRPPQCGGRSYSRTGNRPITGCA